MLRLLFAQTTSNTSAASGCHLRLPGSQPAFLGRAIPGQREEGQVALCRRSGRCCQTPVRRQPPPNTAFPSGPGGMLAVAAGLGVLQRRSAMGPLVALSALTSHDFTDEEGSCFHKKDPHRCSTGGVTLR